MYLVESIKKDIRVLGDNIGQPILSLHLVGTHERDGWGIAYIIHRLKIESLAIRKLEVVCGLDLTSEITELFRALDNSGFEINIAIGSERKVIDERIYKYINYANLVGNDYFNEINLKCRIDNIVMYYEKLVPSWIDFSKEINAKLYFASTSNDEESRNNVLEYIWNNPELYYCNYQV